jgi:hypothetical protein
MGVQSQDDQPETVLHAVLAGMPRKPYSRRMEVGSASSPTIKAFRATLDLFQTRVDLMRQNLRRRNPTADEPQIERLLQEWLLDRAGAEAGDCSGRPIDVKSRFA